ncbi:MAG: rRNA small subunit methyltransferase B [Micromonosporaceae bacterium]|nr:rRNA small subunit methyltransferase B [Micromonosporaceae bacterium]
MAPRSAGRARGAPRRGAGHVTSGRRPRRPGRGGRAPARRGAGRASDPPHGPRDGADPARRAAYDVLRAVADRDAYANLTLPRLLTQRQITGRDAAFATELCYGALRGQGTLDVILAESSSRSLERVDPPVRDALRLGAYQLLCTRVPPHAAVSTAVALARSERGAGAAGFVNAVLRRVAERDLDAWVAALAPPDELGRLALAHAHPVWIAAAISEALDGDLTETARALAANNERPAVHLVALPGRIDRDQLVAETDGEPGSLSPCAVRLPGGAPGDLPAVAGHRAAVQDEGSQLVALAVANARLDGADSRWLDLCAGPGGKAALLGAVARQRGAGVVAVEVSAHRARLVRSSVDDLPVRVIQADGRDVGRHADLPEGRFDRVLVDAPCTGLGALRRRPEARWRRAEADLAGLTALQRELLTAGLRAVRPGGVLGYVTCSPHRDETSAVVEWARREQADRIELLDARPLLAPAAGLGDGPTAQLWPHRHGADAMFLALIRRSG